MSCNFDYKDSGFIHTIWEINDHCRQNNELLRQILAELRLANSQRPPAVITTINGVPVLPARSTQSFHGVP